jgi:hypothetical protein
MGACFLVTMGTHWECIGNSPGTGWELSRNGLGTLCEHIENSVGNDLGTEGMHLNVFRILLFYIAKFYRYTVLYIVRTMYCTSYKPVVYSSPRMGSVVIEPMSQHSAFILCIRLSLDNPYGTIIS